jgi:diguanylate cyclase (GGDEF)-like protein
LKILVVESSPITLQLIERNLQCWGYDVISFSSEPECQSIILSEECPRIALLDWSSPSIDGLELCRMIRGRNKDSYIYTILLSSKNKPEDLVKGLNAGADDYITKPFNTHELQVRLRTGERIIQLQSDLLETRELLQQAAITDTLTGLFNRRALYSHMQQELIRSKRGDSPFGLIMLDIDHFKSVNDSYGHITGDHVLREASHRILKSIREYDVAGRYGGEEFLVQTPDCSEQSTSCIAERIRQSFQNTPFHVSNHSIPISVSAGFMSVQGKAFDCNIEILVNHIDKALYKAKRNGRNRIENAGEIQGDFSI